mmetsp:Transcript_6043/g.23996  ORF Transcript_6043/g.23996 Transcript_6043/m.23996 type:complete len:204 (+) Transcript_6043:1491-2102(+)
MTKSILCRAPSIERLGTPSSVPSHLGTVSQTLNTNRLCFVTSRNHSPFAPRRVRGALTSKYRRPCSTRFDPTVHATPDTRKTPEALGVMVSRIVCSDCGAKTLFSTFARTSASEVSPRSFDTNVPFDGVNSHSKRRLFTSKGKRSGFFKSTSIFTSSPEAHTAVCSISIVRGPPLSQFAPGAAASKFCGITPPRSMALHASSP